MQRHGPVECVPHHRPEFPEKGIGSRQADRTILEAHVSEQVQSLSCARGRHVQQSPGFERSLLRIETLQPGVDRIRLGPGLLDRRNQQSGSRLRGRLGPEEQLFVVVARRTRETGQDHVIELKALRLVHRHDLQAFVGVHIGKRVELVQSSLKRGIHRTRPLMGLEVVKVDSRVFQVRLILDAGRSAEREPRGLHAVAQRRAQPVRNARKQDGPHALEACAPFGRQARHAIGILHQFEYGVLGALREAGKVFEHEPAPRRTQHREPGQPVGRVRQRTRQREQVLDDRSFCERFDLHGTKRETGGLELRHDLGEVAASAHENGHCSNGILGLRLAHQVDDPGSLPGIVLVEERMHRHRFALQRRMHGHRRGIGHGPGHRVLPRRHHSRKGRVDPLHDARL